MHDDSKKAPEPPEAADDKRETTDEQPAARPREIGGRGGLDPPRSGDWATTGRCIEF